mgnify:CR=1 FL=1
MHKQYSIGLDLLILVLSVFFCLLVSSMLFNYLVTFFEPSADFLSPDHYLLNGFSTQLIGFIGGFFLYLKLSKQSFNSIISLKMIIIS